MAITPLIHTQASGYAGRTAGNYIRFRVDTESELPTVDVINGDSGFTADTGFIYSRAGGAWVNTTTTAAHKASHENGGTDEVALDISQTTGLQAALDAKQASGSYATGTGSANGTNTGDNATNTQYSGLAASKQATLVSGTNIKTVNGSTLLGSGDLSVSAADPSYTPGSFTVATGTGRMIIKRMQLTGSQRATIAGTSRLRLT